MEDTNVRRSVSLRGSIGPQSSQLPRHQTLSAKQATVTIPVIMAYDEDPCWQWVRRQPRATKGNITGLATLVPELSGKQLELPSEIVPKLSQVAVIGEDVTRPDTPQPLREINLAADAFRVQLQYLRSTSSQGYRDWISGRKLRAR